MIFMAIFQHWKCAFKIWIDRSRMPLIVWMTRRYNTGLTGLVLLGFCISLGICKKYFIIRLNMNLIQTILQELTKFVLL